MKTLLSLLFFFILISAPVLGADFYRCDNSVITDQPWNYQGCTHAKTGQPYTVSPGSSQDKPAGGSNRTHQIVASLQALSGEVYAVEVLSRLSELLAISKVGAARAQSCDWNLRVYREDKDGSCLALADYFTAGSRYMDALNVLSALDNAKFKAAASADQAKSFDAIAREFSDNAAQMGAAFDFYAEFLKQ